MRTIAEIIVAVLLTLIAYKDFKTKKISWLWIVMTGIVAFVFRLTVMKDSWVSALGGLIIGALFFLIGKYSKEAIGYGDSWLILILGVFVGIKNVLEMVVLALFFASLYALMYCAWRGWRMKCRIPFVPFLTIAYIGVMFL